MTLEQQRDQAVFDMGFNQTKLLILRWLTNEEEGRTWQTFLSFLNEIQPTNFETVLEEARNAPK